jgi:hypothetical protein
MKLVVLGGTPLGQLHRVPLGVALQLGRCTRELLNAERDVSAFTARFGAADGQPSDASAAVRLAGVYALAALADDWTAQQQHCIDAILREALKRMVQARQGTPPP